MSFVVTRPVDQASAEAPAPPEADPAVLEAMIAERVAHEVGLLRAAAEAEGRARGEAAARRVAEAAEAARAAEVTAAIGALGAAWAQLSAPLGQKEEDLAALVTELAFVLARHILRLEIALRPESVQPLVEGLVEEAARARAARQSIVIRLHPADHAFLEPRTAIEHAHLLADAQIERGGAIVELITAGGDPIDKIEWDGTLASRLEVVRAALGLAPAPRRQAA